MFAKMENSKLLGSIASYGRHQAKYQALLTNLVAQCVYQSIANNNIDPGIKLVGALSSNGYNRRNDVITYLCNMGNFTFKKDKGLQFKPRFPKDESFALEMGEKCIANPMFTIVKEKAVKTEIDVLADIKALYARIKREIDTASKEGRTLSVQHEEYLVKLQAIAS